MRPHSFYSLLPAVGKRFSTNSAGFQKRASILAATQAKQRSSAKFAACTHREAQKARDLAQTVIERPEEFLRIFLGQREKSHRARRHCVSRPVRMLRFARWHFDWRTRCVDADCEEGEQLGFHSSPDRGRRWHRATQRLMRRRGAAMIAIADWRPPSLPQRQRKTIRRHRQAEGNRPAAQKMLPACRRPCDDGSGVGLPIMAARNARPWPEWLATSSGAAFGGEVSPACVATGKRFYRWLRAARGGVVGVV